jgi:hypothetical protein
MPGARGVRVGLLSLCATLAATAAFAQEAPHPRVHVPGFLPEHRLLNSGAEIGGRYVAEKPRTAGPFFSLRGIAPGSGGLALALGLRQDIRRVIVEVSGAISPRAYKTAQLVVEVPGLANGKVALGVQSVWQDFTQVNYFGTGTDSAQRDRSHYRLGAIDSVGYITITPAPSLTVQGVVGSLAGVSVGRSTGLFGVDLPEATTTFPNEPLMRASRQPRYAHAGVSIAADTRDYPEHPTNGALYRAGWTTYRDRTFAAYSFDRTEFDVLRVVPLADRWRLIGYGVAAFTRTASGQQVPFYLLPTMGGGHSLRSFQTFRFADRHLAQLRVESRWSLTTHVDLAAFADAGSVAAVVRDLDRVRTSVGFGLRLHAHTTTVSRMDFAYGREGWSVVFSMSDPFRLKRLTKWTTAAPFVW